MNRIVTTTSPAETYPELNELLNGVEGFVDMTLCYGTSYPKYLASLRIRHGATYTRAVGDSDEGFSEAIVDAVHNAEAIAKRMGWTA